MRKRMWINQPSTGQPLYALHGTNVLAAHEHRDTCRVYFLEGPVESMQVLSVCLADGWNTRGREDDMRTIAEKLTAIEERAILERRACALHTMELTLEELAKRETLCRAEIVHFTKLLRSMVEGAK